MLRYPFKAKIIIIKLERESNSLKKDLQSYTLPVCYLIKTFGILLKYNMALDSLAMLKTFNFPM